MRRGWGNRWGNRLDFGSDREIRYGACCRRVGTLVGSPSAATSALLAGGNCPCRSTSGTPYQKFTLTQIASVLFYLNNRKPKSTGLGSTDYPLQYCLVSAGQRITRRNGSINVSGWPDIVQERANALASIIRTPYMNNSKAWNLL